MNLLELQNAKWIVEPVLLLAGVGSVRVARKLYLAKLTVYTDVTPVERVLHDGVPLELEAFGRIAAVGADMFPHIHLNTRPHVLVPVEAAMQVPRYLTLFELVAGELLELDVDPRGNFASLFCGLPPGELVLPP